MINFKDIIRELWYSFLFALGFLLFIALFIVLLLVIVSFLWSVANGSINPIIAFIIVLTIGTVWTFFFRMRQ